MKDKVCVGKWFKNEGRLAIVIEYISYDHWLCGYLFKDEYFIIKADKIINSMKEEENKSKMKLEYKFYEKNLAPKWLEGDYDLHIEGNKMVMTSKDGKQVEARCHPDDDWRLQVGIDELKERMAEAKQSREIKVGDVVRVTNEYCWNVAFLADFLQDVNAPIPMIVELVKCNTQSWHPAVSKEYVVYSIGLHDDEANHMVRKLAIIQNRNSDTVYVVNYSNLELVVE